jgi:hypothetical protein
MSPAKRKAPLQFDLSGFGEVHDVILELGARHGNNVERRLARAALGAALTESARLIRNAAPRGTRIRKSVGKRFNKNRRIGVHEAKAGLNVGSKSGTAPHAHFFTLGTKARYTKRGQFRGSVPENVFVKQAIEQNSGSIRQKMMQRVMKRLPIELERARRRSAGKGISRLPGPADSNVLIGG